MYLTQKKINFFRQNTYLCFIFVTEHHIAKATFDGFDFSIFVEDRSSQNRHRRKGYDMTRYQTSQQILTESQKIRLNPKGIVEKRHASFTFLGRAMASRSFLNRFGHQF